MSGPSIPSYPPSKLGEYTVIRDIAEGTFGKVKSELRPILLGLSHSQNCHLFL